MISVRVSFFSLLAETAVSDFFFFFSDKSWRPYHFASNIQIALEVTNPLSRGLVGPRISAVHEHRASEESQ